MIPAPGEHFLDGIWEDPRLKEQLCALQFLSLSNHMPQWEESSSESVRAELPSVTLLLWASHWPHIMCCILKPALSLPSSRAALGSCLVFHELISPQKITVYQPGWLGFGHEHHAESGLVGGSSTLPSGSWEGPFP